jgi:hypothetical protein
MSKQQRQLRLRLPAEQHVELPTEVIRQVVGLLARLLLAAASAEESEKGGADDEREDP